MAELEKEVEAMIYAGLGQGEQDTNATSNPRPQESPATEQEPETGERTVIDVDLYRFPGGAVLLVPGGTANPLDTNAVESDSPQPETTIPPQIDPTEETTTEEQEATAAPEIPTTPIAPLVPRRSRGTSSPMLILLVLLLLLSAGAASYVFLLPLTTTATVTITPDTKTLQAQTTLTIAQRPTSTQVQGRTLAPFSLTASKTVAVTGHGHQDATRATGVITFYNDNPYPYTIPAGVTFTPSRGVTVVTSQSVTVQAVIPPMLGTAYVPAHVIETGSVGNIPAEAINTRCCGSVFVTATNTTAFRGGEDARNYSFIQTSDIHEAATDLLGRLTPTVTAALSNQMHTGEQLVPPFCTPHTSSSKDPGEEAASVTVSVTQTCKSVAHQLDSLEQVAATLLAYTQDVGAYQQVGTVQVTINGSTYTKTTAQLHISETGVWVYHFSQGELSHMTRLIAGETQENATHQLESQPGIQHVSIHVSRLDLKNQLPTDPAHIHLELFIVSMS
jgi:hypothetical protein